MATRVVDADLAMTISFLIVRLVNKYCKRSLELNNIIMTRMSFHRGVVNNCDCC